MSQKLISKSLFLDFLFCSKNAWLKSHRSDLGYMFVPSAFDQSLMEQGREVDTYARNLFPGGSTVPVSGDKAALATAKFLTEKVPAIYQATFIVDGFVAKNDILVYNKDSQKWDLFEVKATNSVKEDGAVKSHIDDLAFQVALLKRSNIPFGKLYIVHMNKEYKKRGDLDPVELFQIEDRTEIVLNKLPWIDAQMEAAKEYLGREEEPKGNCDCIFKGRSQHCETFSYSNPEVPEYSVHDIARIGKEKLKVLVEQEIWKIEDVPSHIEFTSEIQFNQIQVHKNQSPVVNKEEIKNALSGLEFPLYFFDYETFAPAIPTFDGFSPYKKIPFQFSLHVLKEGGGELEHFEYLHEVFSDPSEKVAELLDQWIGPKGTVIVWNKSFEASVNKEIAERQPKYAKTLERINDQLFDLMDIFRDQHFVHHNFQGSTSIKYVLPVLAPHLSYAELGIKDGAQASDAWWRMVSPITTDSDKNQIAKDLKIYCGLDTLAMYEVWKYLKELI